MEIEQVGFKKKRFIRAVGVQTGTAPENRDRGERD